MDLGLKRKRATQQMGVLSYLAALSCLVLSLSKGMPQVLSEVEGSRGCPIRQILHASLR